MPNYHTMLCETIRQNEALEKKPRLLLHACCAPCSSYVLELLAQHFEITLYFYNPNISPREEYDFRLSELKRLVKEMSLEDSVKITAPEYCADEFFAAARGLENIAEGGERCFKCYRLRLEKTALAAKDGGYDFFCTTLSISPHKNAQKLNEIGEQLAKQYGVPYLFSDFKKNNGYKRSIELSKQFGLYRQNYCGCVFSKQLSQQKRD